MPKYNLKSKEKKSSQINNSARRTNSDGHLHLQPLVRIKRLSLIDNPLNLEKTFCVKSRIVKIREKKYKQHKKCYFWIFLCFSSCFFLLFLYQGKIKLPYDKLLTKVHYKTASNFLQYFPKKFFDRGIKLSDQNNTKRDLLNIEKAKSNVFKIKNEIKEIISDYLQSKKTPSFCSSNEEEKIKFCFNTSARNAYKSKDLSEDYLTSVILHDYALDSKGAKIYSIFNTKTYSLTIIKFFNYDFKINYNGFLPFSFTNGPKSVLIPWTKPGDCWAFHGSNGEIEVELSQAIYLEGISLDHIRTKNMANKSIQSAPKRFRAIGVADSENSGFSKVNLGTFQYDINGPVLQTFLIKPKPNIIFKRVHFKFLSNHGNKHYTCVYKIRVHGHR